MKGSYGSKSFLIEKCLHCSLRLWECEKIESKMNAMCFPSFYLSFEIKAFILFPIRQYSLSSRLM